MEDGHPGLLKMTVQANKQSPIENLALVIRNWGKGDANLQINGQNIERGKEFHFGQRQNIQSHDLIVWIKLTSAKPADITLSPTN